MVAFIYVCPFDFSPYKVLLSISGVIIDRVTWTPRYGLLVRFPTRDIAIFICCAVWACYWLHRSCLMTYCYSIPFCVSSRFSYDEYSVMLLLLFSSKMFFLSSIDRNYWWSKFLLQFDSSIQYRHHRLYFCSSMIFSFFIPRGPYSTVMWPTCYICVNLWHLMEVIMTVLVEFIELILTYSNT